MIDLSLFVVGMLNLILFVVGVVAFIAVVVLVYFFLVWCALRLGIVRPEVGWWT